MGNFSSVLKGGTDNSNVLRDMLAIETRPTLRERLQTLASTGSVANTAVTELVPVVNTATMRAILAASGDRVALTSYTTGNIIIAPRVTALRPIDNKEREETSNKYR